MVNSSPLFTVTLFLLFSSLELSAGVRIRSFNNQIEIEVSHPDGLLGYVVKSPGRNGVIEANPAIQGCPKTQTEVLKPQINHNHGHWVMLSTCNGESFMYSANVLTPTWEDVKEEDYTPPSEDEDDDSLASNTESKKGTKRKGMLTILAGIAAVASVLSLGLLLMRGRKEKNKH